jgi:adenylate cyclase
MTALSQVPDFVVVDRTTLDHTLKEAALAQTGLMDTQQAIRLGRQLSVQALLKGNIQVAGDQVRISASVVDLESGQVHTAEQVTGELKRIFEMQDELARRFIAHQGIRLAEERSSRLDAIFRSTDTLQAYDHYQRGRNWYLEGTQDGYRRAIEAYAEALRVDPGYALAYAGLAEAEARYGFSAYQRGQPFQAMLLQAKLHAEKALSLRGDIAETHRALALALLKLQAPGRVEAAARAVELAPNDPESLTIHWMAADGKPDSPQILDAIRLSPRFTLARIVRGISLLSQRRSGEALTEFEVAVSASPDDAVPYCFRAQAHLQAGNREAARRDAERALALSPTYQDAQTLMRQLSAVPTVQGG